MESISINTDARYGDLYPLNAYTGWTCDNYGPVDVYKRQVRTNAEQFGKTYDDELHRVIIHGILHLCGINDKGPGEREIMEENENKALALLEGASILKK